MRASSSSSGGGGDRRGIALRDFFGESWAADRDQARREFLPDDLGNDLGHALVGFVFDPLGGAHEEHAFVAGAAASG